MDDLLRGKYTVDDVSHYILLRARSWSYDRISKFMGVSKPTLIKWQKWLDDNSSQSTIDVKEITPYFEKRDVVYRMFYIAILNEIIKRMKPGIDDKVANFVIGALCSKKKIMSPSISTH